MNRSQRIIVVLLIAAILFSAVSIIVSYSALNLYSQRSPGISGQISSSGSSGVSLYVEKPPVVGDEG